MEIWQPKVTFFKFGLPPTCINITILHCSACIALILYEARPGQNRMAPMHFVYTLCDNGHFHGKWTWNEKNNWLFFKSYLFFLDLFFHKTWPFNYIFQFTWFFLILGCLLIIRENLHIFYIFRHFYNLRHQIGWLIITVPFQIKFSVIWVL